MKYKRTLKEQLLWVRRFNPHWLLQRHGHQTPAQVREAHRAEPASAA